MKATATAVMMSTSRPERWEGKMALFGPAEKGPVRFHWYREGSELSACGNHKRSSLACMTWSVDQVACPRCEETLAWAGKPIAPMPVPPADDFDDGPGDDEDEADEAES